MTDTILQDLEVPWALAFFPDGRFIVTERPGRFHLYTGTELKSYRLEHVHHANEGGLLGVAIHPNLKWVYLYYTHEEGGTFWNRIIRTDLEMKSTSLILDRIPAGPRHNGGRIKFGPDGYLYVGAGDTGNSKLAQERTSLAGKILRITDEGKPAPGNPFGNEIYALGIRNCQGITWGKTGQMFVTSHGDIARDNVFLVPGPGANFGWPSHQGDTSGEGITLALLNSGSGETWAPSGLAYYNGALYFCGLRGSSLYRITLDATETKVAKFERLLVGTLGRLREAVIFGDHLYITTSNRDGRGTVREHDDKVVRLAIK